MKLTVKEVENEAPGDGNLVHMFEPHLRIHQFKSTQQSELLVASLPPSLQTVPSQLFLPHFPQVSCSSLLGVVSGSFARIMIAFSFASFSLLSHLSLSLYFFTLQWQN
jgi:hypothetical protein